MRPEIDVLRDLVVDIVTDRVALESVAQRPMGGTNRTFSAITADLMFFDWAKHSHKPVAQIVGEICGTIKRPRRKR